MQRRLYVTTVSSVVVSLILLGPVEWKVSLVLMTKQMSFRISSQRKVGVSTNPTCFILNVNKLFTFFSFVEMYTCHENDDDDDNDQPKCLSCGEKYSDFNKNSK